MWINRVNAQVCTCANICRHGSCTARTNSPDGGGWRRDRSKWLMWVFVTGCLRQCGESHSSLTGVAPAPPSPRRYHTGYLRGSEGGAGANKLWWRGLATFIQYVFVLRWRHIAVCMSERNGDPPNYWMWSILGRNDERGGGWGYFFVKLPTVLLLGDAMSIENTKKREKPTCWA